MAQLGQEPGVDGTEGVDGVVAAAGHHRFAHGKNAIRGGNTQLGVQIAWLDLAIGPVATPAGVARFQGAQGLLEGFLEATANRHRLTHGLHRGGEHRRTAAELLKGEAGNLGNDVVDRGLKTGRCFTGDVVEDFIEGVAHGQAGGDLGDRETGGFGGQGRGAAHPRIHLDHHHIAIGGVDRELDIATAGFHTDLADDRDRLVAQALVFPVGEGLGRGHGDRITGVHPHRIEVLDAAHDHDVVGQIAHHLQLKFLPAEQGLLDQDLGHRAGLKAALADRPEFLGVVGDAAAGAAHGEGGANDARVGANRFAHRFGLGQAGGDAGGAHRHPNPLHGLLKQQAIFRLLDRF